jgi:hypothetical protein
MIVALSVILVMLGGMLQTGRLGTLVLLGLLPMTLIAERAWWPAAAAVAAIVLIGVFFVPDKIIVLSYGLFFGPFGFLWQATRPLKPILRVLLCGAGFNVAWLVGLWFVKSLMWPLLPFMWVFLAGQVAFIAYYYLFDICVHYYLIRFRPILWGRNRRNS